MNFTKITYEFFYYQNMNFTTKIMILFFKITNLLTNVIYFTVLFEKINPETADSIEKSNFWK